MNDDIDISLLRTFLSVCDNGSMTAAARATNKTQGAVSQQIKRLEETLGLPLLERGRRGIVLTRFGEQIAGKARSLLSLNDEIISEAATGTVRGKVRLGIPYDLVGKVMVPILRKFASAFSEVEISIRCGSSPELENLVGTGAIDLALVEAPAETAGRGSLRIERLVWVGARNGQAHRKKPLPISLVADTCAFRPAVAQVLREAGLNWRGVYEGGSIEATAGTVRADLAITVWLESTVPDDLVILAAIDDLPPLPTFAIELHVGILPKNPALEALIPFIREGFSRAD